MIQLGHPQKEGILQVSKWLKIQVLLDTHEMQDLLNSLGEVFFVNVSGPTCREAMFLTAEDFLKEYGKYIQLLREGITPPAKDFRTAFSSALSNHLEAFYAMPVGQKFLVKPLEPVIQLQAHHFIYSELDGKFHPMVCGEGSISWGVQFSYPQLFQDPKTKQIVTLRHSTFLNTTLFSKIQKWMRSHTIPTPLSIQGVRTNIPIRIGKQALSWIATHPDLKAKGIGC